MTSKLPNAVTNWVRRTTRMFSQSRAIAVKATVVTFSLMTASAYAAVTQPLVPVGLAVDQNTGMLYVAQAGSNRVDRYNPNNKTYTNSFVSVSNPVSVAVNSDGLLYVGTVENTPSIYVYGSNGQLINQFTTYRGNVPYTMAFDANNVLYASNGISYPNTASVSIIEYTNDTTATYATGSYGFRPESVLFHNVGTAPLTFGIAVDNGKLYTAFGLSISPLVQNLPLGTKLNTSVAQPAWDASHNISGGPSTPENVHAAAVDGNHNVFYTLSDMKHLYAYVRSAQIQVDLGAMPSSPYGIAFDKKRSVLYVSFLPEGVVEAYTVTYDIAGLPLISAPRTLTFLR
jgi:hypothetical protein